MKNFKKLDRYSRRTISEQKSNFEIVPKSTERYRITRMKEFFINYYNNTRPDSCLTDIEEYRRKKETKRQKS